MFINPIPNSYLTSKFGWRKINKGDGKGLVDDWHQGVDLARQPNTNVEVLAAADGEVIRVGPLSTYGNIVLIKHNIDGEHYETNYAHLKSYSVKKGDKVKQGQKIGIMGNTGVGTGPHLHFEIHNGAWATGQPNAIDPARYIKFYSKVEVQKMQKEIDALKKKVDAFEETKKAMDDFLAAQKEIEKAKLEPASTYAAGALKWAVDVGLLKGNPQGDLMPHYDITRQDFAVVMQRYHDKVTK